MTKLQFVGDLGLWIGLIVALAATVLAWRVYRREVKRAGLDPSLKWKLPLLRGLAVFMLMMMLTGPVLMHRETVGQVARVLVFLDASKSMGLDDRHMEPGRKLVIASRHGWLPPGKVDLALIDAADLLGESQRLAIAAAGAGDRVSLKQGAEALSAKLGEAAGKLGEAKLEAVALPRPGRGSMLWEMFSADGDQRFDDNMIRDVTKNPPTKSGLVGAFDAPANQADNYLLRMRGWVYPPASGEYVFYVSSDDMGALWLSTDDRPDGRKQIAMNPNTSGRGNWPEGTAKSGGVKLEAGRAYYIEAIVKEGSGEDYLAIGWRMPDGKMERPIAGAHLSPFASPNDRDAASGDLLARLGSELVDPAKKVADTGLGAADAAEVDRVRATLRELAATAGRFEQSLRATLDRSAEQLIAANDAAVKAAFDRFDQTNRWDRAQQVLLDGDGAMLATLAKSHDVELLALSGHDAQRLWTPTADNKTPAKLDATPIGVTSDLATGVRDKMIGSRDTSAATAAATAAADPLPGVEQQRTAAVLITDGRHNDGDAPLALARVLGDRRMPVFTVSMGAGVDPKDLAVLGVEAPQTVYQDDRVAGRVLISDHMPPGKAFTLRIEHEGKTVWSTPLNTAGVGKRYVDYDLAIRELVDAAVKGVKGDDAELTVNALPLAMRAVIDPVEGEQRPDNNAAPMNVQASTQKRKLLLIDSRPRWETRYIRNLFERDERWTVNTILVGPATERDTLRRGEADGEFPKDREALYGYDLVILGEVPADTFESADLESLKLFVAERGGGLVLLDGPHALMRTLADSPLGDALPVEWAEGDRAMQMPHRLELTELGAATAALSVVGDATENDRFWRIAPMAKQVVRIKPLPGAETLVEAVRDEDRTPAFVFRRFGSGRVLYMGDDELWRWRYKVADLYHQRLWHQLANWIMEEPYSIADEFVSLDAGGPVYRPGDRARVRVRLRDAEGKPILHATVQAVLWKGDKRVSTVTLDADQSTGGAFRGQTEPLDPGDWRVTVEVTGFAEKQIKASTTFKVEPPDTGEMALLTANEPLLSQMADDSGGRFMREEDAGRLAAMLEPLSAGQIVESETALWQSYWWFLPMIGALGLEWWIRKRAGMI